MKHRTINNKSLVVYHYVPHYRKAVFEAMINEGSFYVAAGETTNNDIKVEVFDEKSQFTHSLTNIWLFKGLLWQRKLLSLVLKEQYQNVIFLASPYFISTWVAVLLVKIRGGKVLFWTHGFVRDNSFKERLKLRFLKLADCILLYGDKAKKNLIHNGIEPRKLHAIYNSLDYDAQKVLREQITPSQLSATKSSLFIKPNCIQVLFIGRLTAHKKLHELILMLAKLRDENLSANLLFVGDGAERLNLEQLVHKHALEKHVTFYGACHDENELACLICSSDVCISPGEIGLTAMHSLAYGVPVITHDDERCQMPEFEAVIHGKTGWLFEHGSFCSLVETMRKFISEPIPQVRQNCIEEIESRYTPDKQLYFIKKAIKATYES
ncbi:glycosyltransferase [Thalassotalea atypica]|uniref:glycosyltransferase n=1 Tax=Thalassotalea atypica TaxID=2054316 RepID=UPI002573B5BD|nr:glycosyltransferase [Thalassotalea atypica]